MVMSALIETTPIPAVIEKLMEREARVLDPSTAEINQLKGVEEALAAGYTKIGVTVMGSDAGLIPAMRGLEGESGAAFLILVIHTTGVKENLIPFIEKADIVYACASRVVRKSIGPRARAIFGKNIPAYALTGFGEMILRIQEKIVLKRGKLLAVEGGKTSIPSFVKWNKTGGECPS